MKYRIPLIAISISMLSMLPLQISNADDMNPILQKADQVADDAKISPARRFDREISDQLKDKIVKEALLGFRQIDGTGNNPYNSKIGSANIQLKRMIASNYSDGISSLAGSNRSSARIISNIVSDQKQSIPDSNNLSDFLWQWGQFLDHDIDLTDGMKPPEPHNIPVPAGDPYFDPNNENKSMAFNRSIYDTKTGTSILNPRQQVNEITAWIDASNVYGSNKIRATALRTLDGTGELKISSGNLLPFNTEGFPNAGGKSEKLFLAGDIRANEQVGLTAMHTLFVREHNRLAKKIAIDRPDLNGDQLYEKARKLVGAEIQKITYNEYLPVLLGENILPSYEDYQPKIDASISNLFSTAAYRFGHSALNAKLLRLDAKGNEITAGHLALRDAFFRPSRLIDEGGIDPVLRGLAAQVMQKIDPFMIDDIRNFLFGPPSAGGFDLIALNIQRGRDHGLPSYNDTREKLGLKRVASFAEISTNSEIQDRLAKAYNNNVDNIDVWIGGLAENPVNKGLVGELFSKIMIKQFTQLRDGDRFWYERTLTTKDREMISNIRLSDIIRNNTNIGKEIPDNVFKVSLTTTK